MEITERIQRERQFHNQWARSLNLSDLRVRESFEACTAIENRYALSEMGDLRGKRVLDLGCGAGETSVYFAMQGAKVTACDVSEDFLNIARSLASRYGVPLHTLQVDAGRLPFALESFDYVFGNGLLHHVDLQTAAKEIQKVLKRGGKAIFIEPLPYNPVINVYRAMAKGVRTDDEKPLAFRDLEKIKSYFSTYSHREFWLFSLLLFLDFFFVRRWHPGKVRYWKKVIDEAETYKNMFAFLQRLDHFALTYFPFLRYFCWNTVLVMEK